MRRLSAKLFQKPVTYKKTMAFDTSRLVSGTSLRWIYDGQYTPTDFLVYLLAVDEKGRLVRADGGVQDERRRRRREDRTEGTLRRFRTPLILPTSISLCRRVFLRLPALWPLYIVRPPFSPPIDRETRNGDSLNLDPVLMEHSPDNGFGMLWRLDVSRIEYSDLVWIWLAEERRTKALIKKDPERGCPRCWQGDE